MSMNAFDELVDLKRRMKKEYERLFQLCLNLNHESGSYQMAYAAKQALAWASDPTSARSAYDVIEGWRNAELQPPLSPGGDALG
jgi:hypothetical protein